MRKGFTMIELLIVISILSLLIVVAIPAYGNVQKKARDAKRKSDLKALQAALESYNADNGGYPVASQYRGLCDSFNQGGTVKDSGIDGYIPDLAPKYIQKLPRDPRENKIANSDTACSSLPTQTCYKYKSDGSEYKLVAQCGVETLLTSKDPFFDPRGYNSVTGQGFSFQISSNDVALNTW